MIQNYIISSYDHRLVEYYPFIRALKSLKRNLKATAYLLPTSVTTAGQEDSTTVPFNTLSLFDEYVTESKELNKHFVITPGTSHAFRKNPLTGFEGLYSKHTVVMGGLPRVMETLPSPKFTRQIATAGSIGILSDFVPKTSGPNSSGRNWKLAKHLARPSASIVMVNTETNRVFHRYVQYDFELEGFYDLGYFYSGKDGSYSPLYGGVMLLGDLHAYEVDHQAFAATLEQINALQPETIIIQDGFNGSSVNHHEFNKPTAYSLSKKIPTILEEQAVTLGILAKICQEHCKYIRDAESHDVQWLQSNHDEFLVSYLDNVQLWTKDRENIGVAAEIFSKYINNHKTHPINTLLELDFNGIGWIPNTSPKRFFETYVTHGDYGLSGARGLNVFKSDTLMGSTASGHCLTLDHEVLVVNKGFVPIHQVEKGDKVYGYHKGSIKITEVKDTTFAKYTGDLQLFKHKYLNQFMTDNHHLYTKNDEYLPCTGRIPLADLVISAEPLEHTAVDISEDMIRLKVAVAADGSIEGLRVRFHLKKTRKIERLTQLLNNLKIEYNVGKKGEFGNIKISFLLSDLFEQQKTLGDTFKCLSKEQRKVFIDELCLWDGSINRSKGYQFSTSKIEEAVLITEILLQQGILSHFYARKNRDTQNQQNYVVFFRLTPSPAGVNKHQTIRDQVTVYKVTDTPVACITTTLSNFFVKTPSGTIELTGNTHVPLVVNNSARAGTLSILDPAYKKGISGWAHSNLIIYPGKAIQQLRIIDGETIL